MKFFSKKRQDPDGDRSGGVPSECQHATLAPRWDSPSDMGKRDKVTEYRCSSCKALFGREEGEALMERHEERARSTLLGGE
ncbi:MAG: hypothetical protein AB7I38_17765 [Dehalococcoidia bacterium]